MHVAPSMIRSIDGARTPSARESGAMRLRSLVLPAVLAFGVTVVAPAHAQAAVECGLVVPSKVVIDAPQVETPMRLTNGCYANGAVSASWELKRSNSDRPVEDVFELGDGQALTRTWRDDAPGEWYWKPRLDAVTADGRALSQNYASVDVKYASELATAVTRTKSGLTWKATATQWSGRSHKEVARAGVRVGVFHQPTSRSAWTFVKSVRTSSTGRATVSITRPETGNYRLVVGETPTVWAAYSRVVKGRV